MGVDYDGVGGVGILFTEDMAEKCIEKGLFSEEEWNENQYESIENLGISFGTAGSEYSGDRWYYLFVDGGTLGEVNKNAIEFTEKLKEFGIDIDPDDLEIIEDIHIW